MNQSSASGAVRETGRLSPQPRITLMSGVTAILLLDLRTSPFLIWIAALFFDFRSKRLKQVLIPQVTIGARIGREEAPERLYGYWNVTRSACLRLSAFYSGAVLRSASARSRMVDHRGHTRHCVL